LTPTTWARNAGLLSAATVLISAANYGFTLAIVRLLRPEQFSDFAAGQAVLLVIGNASMAAIPWAVARYIAVDVRPHARGEAMRFGLRASGLQAVVAAAVSALVLVDISGQAVATVTAAGAALMSLSAGPIGYLQGTDRVPGIARLRLIEGVFRVGSGLIAVFLFSRTAAMGLLGFAVGGAVLLGLALFEGRDAWPLRVPEPVASQALITQSLRLGGVQLLMCMLGALDTVAASAADFPTPTTASYQAAALLGRIPLFISTAVAIAIYTELTRAPDDAAVAAHMRHLLRLYGAITFPIALACWTMPHQVLSLLIPPTYASAATLLKFTIISGATIGMINCLTTAHQARGRFRSAGAILVPAAVLQPFLLIWLGRSYGITAFATGLVSLSVVTLAAIGVDARRWLQGLRLRPTPMQLLSLALSALAFVHSLVVWPLAILGVAVCLFVQTTRKKQPAHG
jgi:O-antigen/teichoic acid export membrane protein